MGLFKRNYLKYSERLIKKLREFNFHDVNWFWNRRIKNRVLVELEHEDLQLIEALRNLHKEREDVPELSAKILNLCAHLQQEVQRLKRDHDEKEIEYDANIVKQLISNIDSIFRREARLESNFIKSIKEHILRQYNHFHCLGHGTTIDYAESILSSQMEINETLLYTAFPLERSIHRLLLQLFTWQIRGPAIVIVMINKREFPTLGSLNRYFNIRTSSEPHVNRAFIRGYILPEKKLFILNSHFRPDNQIEYAPKLDIPQGIIRRGAYRNIPQIPQQQSSNKIGDVW